MSEVGGASRRGRIVEPVGGSLALELRCFCRGRVSWPAATQLKMRIIKGSTGLLLPSRAGAGVGIWSQTWPPQGWRLAFRLLRESLQGM